MNTEEQKTNLLKDFRNYLEQNNLDTMSVGEQPDLNSLLSAMAGLKAEVKAESKHFKSTVEVLSSALATVQNDNKTLSAELAAYAERLEKQQYDIIRSMLLDIIDLYDRLSTGQMVLQNYQPVAKLFKRSRAKDIRFINRFQEGQAMTIRRFEQLLQRHQVQVIECVGKLLDPVTMNAVETASDNQLGNGIVLEELRKGFLFQGQVLRLAEVKVNKTNVRYKTL